MIATKSISNEIKTRARSFLKALQEHDFQKVWHQQITQEAANLLAATLFISYAYNENMLDKVFNLPTKFNDAEMSILDSLSFAFHEDIGGMRTSFFEGWEGNFRKTGWYKPDFSSQGCQIFTDTFGENPTALLITKTPGKPLILPFVKDNNTYKIDFEVLTLFSMYITPSGLYEIGTKSIEMENEEMAVALFELIGYLEVPYKRLKRTLIRDPLGHNIVTSQRKAEIAEQEIYFLKARNQIIKLSSPKPSFLNTGSFHALLVGVDKYDDSEIQDLAACVNDANTLYEVLTSSYDNVRLLTATTNNGLPTRTKILAELNNIAQSLNTDDLLLFYFSGHGIASNGESYLLPRDAHCSLTKQTGIAMKDVGEILKNCPARAKVMIIDSCHSGASIGKSENTMTLEFLERVFKEAEGTAVLASCKQEQRSYVWPEQKLSVYTYYLTDAMKGKADIDNKGFVTVSNVNLYVTSNVKAWSSKHNKTQTPTLNYSVVGDIILNRYVSQS